MRRRRGLIGCAAALAAAGGPAAAAGATAVSSNWAGYVARGHTPQTRFEHVAGRWTQPTASCGRRQTYSAFWVGLRGYTHTVSKLEQIGTEADCDRQVQPSYAAWFELVPAPPVRLGIRVMPGDAIAASVAATGDRMLLNLRDETSGREVTRRVRLNRPDTSSAEWIAEAPSVCERGQCRTLPLTDFGSVSFTGAGAQLAGGPLEAISSRRWRALAIELQGDFVGVSASNGPVFAGASPGALSAAGSAFSVTWTETAAPAPAAPPSIGPLAPEGAAPGA
jgi:hypothetical protein